MCPLLYEFCELNKTVKLKDVNIGEYPYYTNFDWHYLRVRIVWIEFATKVTK